MPSNNELDLPLELPLLTPDPDPLIRDVTKKHLAKAIGMLVTDVCTDFDLETVEAGAFPATDEDAHMKDTPSRVIRMYEELLSGAKTNAAEVLTTFPCRDIDQMVHVLDIDFVSVCAHHLLPFHGKVHFAYLPHERIVGLSKIPRMIDILSHRLQIQERLANQIVEVFQHTVHPHGCGVVIQAFHGCMGIRGVKKPHSRAHTTALRGCFQKDHIKAEFLSTVLSPRT